MSIYIPKTKVKYQSINEILLKKLEPFLTITWEPDFSQAYSFLQNVKAP